MKNIVLIGFSGSGKTTVGRLLAQKLNMNFFDTDEQIKKMQNLSVFDIFEKHGEGFFRQLENQLLLEVPKKFVVSLGGGTLLCPNFEHLKKDALIVFLKTSYNTALTRLKGSEIRPLLAKKSNEQTAKLFSARQQLCQKHCDLTVETDNLPPSEVAEEIARQIQVLF